MDFQIPVMGNKGKIIGPSLAEIVSKLCEIAAVPARAPLIASRATSLDRPKGSPPELLGYYR